MTTILIVEDQPENQSIYTDIIYHVQMELGLQIQQRLASSFEEAQQTLDRALKDPEEVPLLILLKVEIPYKGRKDKRAGYRLMQQYREHFISSYWVPLAANIAWHEKDPSSETSLFDDLYKLRPFDVFSKGENTNDLENIVRRALLLYVERTETRLQEDASSLPEAIIRFGNNLYAMLDYQLYHEIRSAAENKRGILLFGEPGTGKTLTTRLIHYYSDRRYANFRSIDSIIEGSELEKRLFPSSKQTDDDSLLGQAQGGTLYIANFDRLGNQDDEESQRLQRKLLHYLKYRNYDVRIIGGINRSRKGFPIFSRFLPEILDTMIPLDLPPLRERKDDIPLLIGIFLEQFNRQRKEKNEKPKRFVNLTQIYELLQAQDWRHNNIAQLQKVVNEVLLKSTLMLTADDFKTVLERWGMRFLVSLRNYPDETTSVIIQVEFDTIFHIELPSEQNTTAGWYIRITYLHKTHPLELEALLRVLPQLLETSVDEEAYSTYLKLMLGFYYWLEKEALQESSYDHQYLRSLRVRLENALFSFQQFDDRKEKIRAEVIKEYTKEADIHKFPRLLRVFLCHSSGDKPIVRELYKRLKKVDYIAPWLDEEDLVPGQDWQKEIRNAVRNCDIVIICLSKSSINKVGYVQKEIKFALDVADEQPEGTIFLIPLRLEECSIPVRLAQFHWVNYFEESGFDKLIKAFEFRVKSLT